MPNLTAIDRLVGANAALGIGLLSFLTFMAVTTVPFAFAGAGTDSVAVA